jgi:hypothetical protein
MFFSKINIKLKKRFKSLKNFYLYLTPNLKNPLIIFLNFHNLNSTENL